MSFLSKFPIIVSAALSLYASLASANTPVTKGGIVSVGSSAAVEAGTRSTIRKANAPDSFADKWAVVVGVDKFQDQSWNLEFAVKDAVDFKDYLVDQARFAPDHVKILTGADATHKSIQNAIDWVRNEARRGDLVVLYYRTRGTFAEQEWGNYLAASNSQANDLSGTAFKMSEFAMTVLDKLQASSLAIIVDSDFSEVVLRSIHEEYDKLSPEIDPLIVVNSANSNEIAWESKELKNSVFTHELIKALIAKGGDAMLCETAHSLRDKVKEDVNHIRKYRSQGIGTMGISKCNDTTDVKLACPVTAPRNSAGHDE
jgi:Caspase domain.